MHTASRVRTRKSLLDRARARAQVGAGALLSFLWREVQKDWLHDCSEMKQLLNNIEAGGSTNSAREGQHCREWKTLLPLLPSLPPASRCLSETVLVLTAAAARLLRPPYAPPVCAIHGAIFE